MSGQQSLLANRWVPRACNRLQIPRHCCQRCCLNHVDWSRCWCACCGAASVPGCKEDKPAAARGTATTASLWGKKKETWPWPFEWCGPWSYKEGFSSCDLLRERSSTGTDWEEEQAREESSFLEDATAVTQKPLKTRPCLIRLMILVYFRNNKPTCHNVKFIKLGKIQTVLFIFPSFSIFLV